MDGTVSQAADTSAFGSMFRYNGVVFGDFTAYQADVEGALFVGGNAHLGSPGYGFDITASADAAGGYPDRIFMGNLYVPSAQAPFPAFVLGGTLTQDGNGGQVKGGNTFMRQSYQQEYESKSNSQKLSVTSPYSVTYVEDDCISQFVGTTKNTVKTIGRQLAGGAGTTISHSSQIKLTMDDLAAGTPDELVINANASIIDIATDPSSVQINEIYFPEYLNKYDMVVLNVYAENIVFDGGSIFYGSEMLNTSNPIYYQQQSGSALKDTCQSVIWNFPNATSISITGYGVVGSVFAPNATITTKGGSINGQLFCQSLTQAGGFEQHSFYFSNPDCLLDIDENESSQDESSQEESSQEESSQEESSQEESSQEESSQEESSQDESSQEESSQEESSQDESSQEESSQEESSQDESSQEESSQDESSQEESSQEESSQDESSQDESSQEESSQDESSQDESSQDESSQDESSQEESSQEESSQDESSQDESSQDESSQDESSQDESSQNESSREESSQNESSREESSQNESSREESSQNESSREELSRESPFNPGTSSAGGSGGNGVIVGGYTRPMEESHEDPFKRSSSEESTISTAPEPSAQEEPDDLTNLGDNGTPAGGLHNPGTGLPPKLLGISLFASAAAVVGKLLLAVGRRER